MGDHVISVRLPASIVAALRGSARDARLSVSAALDWLVRHSLGNFGLVRGLSDCAERSSSKLDARIPNRTFEALKLECQHESISISVYVRTLLYHYYITKGVHYLKSDGHYTLAVRHD